MELILDAANAKEADQVIALYPEISAKLTWSKPRRMMPKFKPSGKT
jgi:hypothetical protein